MSAPLMVLDVELEPNPDEPYVIEATTALGVVRIFPDDFGLRWNLEMWADDDDLIAEIIEATIYSSAQRAAEDCDETLRRLRDVVATPLRSEIASLEDRVATLEAVLRDVVAASDALIEAHEMSTGPCRGPHNEYEAACYDCHIHSEQALETQRRRESYRLTLLRARDLVGTAPAPAVEHVSRELSTEDAAEVER